MQRFLMIFAVCATASAMAETVTSPDGRLSVDVSVNGSALSYAVKRDGTTVIESSPLGFTMNGTARGSGVMLGTATGESADDTFPSRHGVHAEARNHYSGRRIPVTHTASGLAYVLEVRVFDSGVAFRYEIAGQGSKRVTAEASAFTIPAGTRIWSQDGIAVYEGIYSGADISAISTGKVMGPPVVGRLADGETYFAITQSGADTGGPNPYLMKSASRVLGVRFPANGDGTTGYSSSDTIRTAWNVLSVGSLDTLVNSDIVECLAPPPDAALFPDGAATSWARPGRSVWDWMQRFPPGDITPDNARQNLDWAARLGWEYSTIDEGWANWNGGNPWPQVKEVTEYAAPLGVKVLLWTRSENLATEAQRTAFFANLKANGVRGFKADFFDFSSVSPAAKERVELINTILREAAENELVVDLHGTGKPLGQFRTFPNLLNIEAVYGKESYPNATATLFTPFGRLFAGPADYTPLGLQGNLQGAQTKAFEIATVVNMAGPLITIAERPDRVAQSPFAPIIRDIPNLWDETKVLVGSEVGEVCALARRTGGTWYVGAMNGADAARTLTVNLGFLEPGVTYQAEIIRDDSETIEYRAVTHETTLSAAMAAGGGFVARLSRPAAVTITALPFVTAFDPGSGSVYAENGEVLSTEPWTNALLADPLPALLWNITSTGSTLTADFDRGAPYDGGAALKVSGTLDAPNDLDLFDADVTLPAAAWLSLVYSRGAAGANSGVRVGLVFEDAPDAPVFLEAGTAATAGWATTEFPLDSYAGKKLVKIFLRFASAEDVPGYAAKIGRLAIYESPLDPPNPPVNLRAENVTITGLDSLDGTLAWEAPAGTIKGYWIYQRNPLTGERRWLGATAGTSFALAGVNPLGEEPDIVFQVAARNASGAPSALVETSVEMPDRPPLTNPLTGTVIGSAGSYQNAGNTRDKVFDNDVTTFFDAANGDGAWAGLDFGEDNASRVVAIRYFPRDSWSDRMVGGVFQGSNSLSFSGAVTLATVTTQPVEGRYTLVAVTNTGSYRYVRYLSPNGGWGNVAEVKFYGLPLPAPGGLKAARKGGAALLSWQSVAGAQSYRVKRAVSGDGPYETIASGATATTFADSGLASDADYFYTVSAVSPASGEGEASAPARAVDFYREWVIAQGGDPDAPGSGFGEDPDGDGRSNGYVYAVPGGVIQVGAPNNGRLTLDVRDDPFVTVAVAKSDDLAVWTPLAADGSADQAGVTAGFHRVSFTNGDAPGKSRQFYRLSVTR